MGQVMFSIIVVCLNEGERLRDTVESIRQQTYDNYEIIVKDGLSTDNSLQLLPKDERIRLYCMQDKGIYDAMNQAAEKARGDFVFFLNCGDYFYEKEVLAKTAEQITIHSTKDGIIFYGDIFEKVTKERVKSNPRMDAFGCYRNVPCHQACFYSVDLVRRKSFDLKYKVRADYEHFLWCFFRGEARMVSMPFVVASYEGDGFSEIKKNRKRSVKEHREIVNKYMSGKQVFYCRMLMTLSLAPLRAWIARNKTTAHIYNRWKNLFYRIRG